MELYNNPRSGPPIDHICSTEEIFPQNILENRSFLVEDHDCIDVANN